jgi:hypothetical protein
MKGLQPPTGSLDCCFTGFFVARAALSPQLFLQQLLLIPLL